MPCQDGGYRDDPPTRYRTPPEVKERLDRATRLLCSLMKQMTDEEVRDQPDEMQVWWAKHQLEDRNREAEEAKETERKNARAKIRRETAKQRKAGLSKLSPEERKALGV